MGDTTYQIDLPYACFGVMVDNKTGRVVDAPPIARWMVGQFYTEVRLWVELKGGKITVLTATWLG